MNKNTITKKIALLILVILIPTIVSALSFSSSPIINTGDENAYTTQNLSCAWTAGGDETTTTVYWYQNGTLIYTQSSAASPAILFSGNTSKNQLWECNVTIENATDNLSQIDNITTINTLPSAPILYNLSWVNQGDQVDIVEDQSYTFKLNSTDVDGDTIEYTSDAGSFCSLSLDDFTGYLDCDPTNSDLQSAETPRVKQIIFNAKDGGSGQGNNLIVDFTVIPFNDQAEFATTPSNQNTPADTVWTANVSGTDEELHYPLNFTIGGELNDNFPGLLVINSTDNTTATISFSTYNGAPTNLHVGTWTVKINVTDSYGSNSSRLATEYSFNLTIQETNHYPNITTNPAFVNGTQGYDYTSYIYGNDSDATDTLNWTISAPLNSSNYCMSNFPWNITTTNTSSVNSSATISITLTNDHVACRDVNITLSDDQGGSKSLYLTLNLTNVNDAPVLYEIGSTGNISAQSIYKYAVLSYQTNVTDIDSLTYDSANSANLTYSINDTFFFAISQSGLLTATPINDSHIGNWSINISVTDGEYTDWRIMNLTVLNNTAPEIYIDNSSYSFYQDDVIEIPFIVIENNNESITINISSYTNFSESIYNVQVISNDYSNSNNNQSNILNMTQTNSRLANDQVGLHIITINSTDELNASIENQSTTRINITILNENDAPIFDQDQDNSSDVLSLGLVVKNVNYDKEVFVTDFDLFLSSAYANESLNMTYNDSGPGIENVIITKINTTSFNLTFVANDTGTQWIELLLIDENNSVTTQNVTFTVQDSTSSPEIKQISPYYNDTTNTTSFSFANASAYIEFNESVNFSENRTVIFDAIISNDTTFVGNNLTYEWYVDSVLNNAILDAQPGVDSSYSKSFGFWSNGTYNITIVATDARFASSSFTWYVNVTDFNRPPIYYDESMEGLIVNLSSEYVNYMSYRNGKQRFYDPDDDLDSDGLRLVDNENESTDLTYSLANPESCPYASLSFNGDDLRIVPTSTGLCQVNFIATDPANETATSDVILLTIIGATSTSGTGSGTSSGGSTTRTQIVTVPIEEEVDVPIPIKIISPVSVDTYANRTINIPITIKNTWEKEIKGVKVNATMALQPNVTYSFDKSYFSVIPVGGEVTAMLSITNYRSEGPFEITIFADVAEPKFTDSSTILINSLEQTDEGDNVKTKVTFARDMLSENPECRELNDLLERADRALNALDYKQALSLVNGVINGCKFLMNEDKLLRQETPSLIESSFDFLDEHADKLVIGAGILLLITIAFYVVAAVKKLLVEK